MHNDPELNGKYLGTISSDFVKIADTIKEASYQLRRRGISDFPIFPISQTRISVGALLLGANEAKTRWDYYISYLEDFEQRGLVAADGLDAFKAAYKDPDEFCCLFVVDADFTNIVFIPYPED
ncbi:hypothetical protein SAMN05421780_111136 [Flexibacter flexilis DSM 6793]|uniref:Uncharacterized protein n=1 Tax=Flexibacter flexilis DSM 6793 TaxID=927664 RepID=A0A1I1MVL7_9BACT|nr:hypothetical protein [Flexibacter flexilis]SFC89487.1 hypothetical protein SAMN05421780_111136 [Flexibacter flexilis DSM 6793]